MPLVSFAGGHMRFQYCNNFATISQTQEIKLNWAEQTTIFTFAKKHRHWNIFCYFFNYQVFLRWVKVKTSTEVSARSSFLICFQLYPYCPLLTVDWNDRGQRRSLSSFTDRLLVDTMRVDAVWSTASYFGGQSVIYFSQMSPSLFKTSTPLFIDEKYTKMMSTG